MGNGGNGLCFGCCCCCFGFNVCAILLCTLDEFLHGEMCVCESVGLSLGKWIKGQSQEWAMVSDGHICAPTTNTHTLQFGSTLVTYLHTFETFSIVVFADFFFCFCKLWVVWFCVAAVAVAASQFPYSFVRMNAALHKYIYVCVWTIPIWRTYSIFPSIFALMLSNHRTSTSLSTSLTIHTQSFPSHSERPNKTKTLAHTHSLTQTFVKGVRMRADIVDETVTNL